MDDSSSDFLCPDMPDALQSSVDPVSGPLARVSFATEHRLFYGDSRKPIFRVVSDAIYPGMWRVVHQDGSLSDMTNLTRALDAAFVMADRGPPRRNQSLLRWRTRPSE
jgi:hypothetical protein